MSTDEDTSAAPGGAFRISTGGWAGLGPEAGAVRQAVFVLEQGIAPEDEWDSADLSALHAVARDAAGTAMATGRLLVHAPGVGRIGRMAVLRPWRGHNVGRAILEALCAAAWLRGDHEVLLHAQCYAQGFYAGAGFTPRGEVFDDVGIPHIEMFTVAPAAGR